MSEDLSLHQFTAVDRASDVGTYVAALEAFDAIEQLQELKVLAREWGGTAPGRRVLDVGCGFGLETLRLAKLVGPGGAVCGIDKSADFIADAKQRAAAAGLHIDFRQGDAQALPYEGASFDCVRAERLLIYLKDPALAIAEMRRVVRPGGWIALIEPDFGTTTVNLPNRSLVRHVMAHEANTAVAQSWLPGQLTGMLTEHGFSAIRIATRVVIFPQDLGAEYFADTGRSAQRDGAITDAGLKELLAGIADLKTRGSLFGTVDYFLFTGVAVDGGRSSRAPVG